MIETLKNSPKKELISIITEQKNTLSQKETEIQRLNHQIKLYQKQLYGKKPEKHKAIVIASQGEFPFGEKVDLDLQQDKELIEVNYHRKKGNRKRTDFSKLELT